MPDLELRWSFSGSRGSASWVAQEEKQLMIYGCEGAIELACPKRRLTLAGPLIAQSRHGCIDRPRVFVDRFREGEKVFCWTREVEKLRSLGVLDDMFSG